MSLIIFNNVNINYLYNLDLDEAFDYLLSFMTKDQNIKEKRKNYYEKFIINGASLDDLRPKRQRY